MRLLCAACQYVLDSDEYSITLWNKRAGESRCRDCVERGLFEPVLQTRECSACEDVMDSDEYSQTQWNKGEGESRCRDCVERGLFEPVPQTHECSACEEILDSDEYTNTQWFKGEGASRCRDCVERGLFEPVPQIVVRECSSCETVLGSDEYTQSQWNKGDGSSRCRECVENGRFEPVDLMLRECASCAEILSSTEYSNTQWSKGFGVSRCRDCVEKGLFPSGLFPTARENHSDLAFFTEHALENPFASGTFRYVAKGEYADGRREGTPCVTKWFKTGAVMRKTFFEDDIKAVERALSIVSAWNDGNYIDKHIQLNRPAVWQFDESSPRSGQKTLVEPFIANFRKWNSNTGWTDTKTEWPRVMQALSHFSYEHSSGQFLLCDLQGGILSNGVVLTDPVILSQKRSYGVTDLGPDGILNFFASHECTSYCSASWRRPRLTREFYRPVMGTTMVHVPTRAALPPPTGRIGYVRNVPVY